MSTSLWHALQDLMCPDRPRSNWWLTTCYFHHQIVIRRYSQLEFPLSSYYWNRTVHQQSSQCCTIKITVFISRIHKTHSEFTAQWLNKLILRNTEIITNSLCQTLISLFLMHQMWQESPLSFFLSQTHVLFPRHPQHQILNPYEPQRKSSALSGINKKQAFHKSKWRNVQ